MDDATSRDREGDRPRHRQVQDRQGWRRTARSCSSRTIRPSSQKFQVNSTPTLFVNGTHVGGALPKEAFKAMIDEKLKLAELGRPGADYYDKEVMGKGEKQFRSKGAGAETQLRNL